MENFKWSLLVLCITCFWIGSHMTPGYALVTFGCMVAWMHIRDFEKEELFKKWK